MLFSYVTVLVSGALQLLELVRLSLCERVIHCGHRVLPLLGPFVQLLEPISTMFTVIRLELLEDSMGSVNAFGLTVNGELLVILVLGPR